jgi:hypothetical protein
VPEDEGVGTELDSEKEADSVNVLVNESVLEREGVIPVLDSVFETDDEGLNSDSVSEKENEGFSESDREVDEDSLIEIV